MGENKIEDDKMTVWQMAGCIGLPIFRKFLVFIHFVGAAVHYYCYYYYFLSCFRSAMFILLLIDELTRIVDFSSVLFHNKQRLKEKKKYQQNSNVRKSRNQLKDWWELNWASERYAKWRKKGKIKSWLSINIAFISGNILPYYQNGLDVVHQASF